MPGFRGGSSVGVRGGRGGGDRGGFRGGRGGRGGAGSPDGRERPSKVPSFFKVISHVGDNDYDDAPVHVHKSSTAAKKPAAHPARRHSRSNDNEEEDTPPTAVSARRGHADDDDDREFQRQRREQSQAAPQRGGRGGAVEASTRGGRGFGDRGGRGFGDRGGRGRGGAATTRPQYNNTKEESSGSDNDDEVKERGPTNVITTVNSDGTEMPARLNSRVFIDGLPWSYEEGPGKPSLEDEIMQFATAWKVGKPLRLIKKPGQGFGFLVFRSPHSIDAAVRVLNGRKFLGRTLRVEVPKARDLENAQDIAGLKDVGKDSFSRQVLLTDLNKVAQPEIIREILRDVAPQLEKRLESIKMTSQNRKAFLTFEDEGDVDPAVTLLDGFNLLGRRIGAVRAAPPGSLQYSRSALGGTRVPAADAQATTTTGPAAVAAVGVAAKDDDDEEAIVPLGMEAASAATAATRANLKRAQATAAAAAATATAAATAAAKAGGANLTGKTAKYNLLDKGDREVFIGNLGDHVTAEQLSEHLAPCGAIAECELLVHPETHLSTGIARVEFALPAYAAYAKAKYHGSRLRGCVLRVDRGDEASAPLASEGATDVVAEDYDEDRYMAEKYGVHDRKAFFKGTSFEDEEATGASRDSRRAPTAEDVEAEDELAGWSTNRLKRARDAREPRAPPKPVAVLKAKAGKAAPKAAAVSAANSSSSGVSGADLGDDDDDEIDFVFGGQMSMDKKSRGDDSDDDSEEERFFDADAVQVGSSADAKKGGKGKGKAKAKGKGKAAAGGGGGKKKAPAGKRK